MTAPRSRARQRRLPGTGLGDRLYRMVLFAYPAPFRRRYGAEMTRTVRDLRRHRGTGRLALWARIGADVVTTAPRMRWENLMSKPTTISLTALLAVAVLAAAVGSPLLLLLVAAVVAVLVVLSRRSGRSRPAVAGPASTAGWYRWVGAGAASFAIGAAVLVVDGDELSEPVWLAWAASWVLGSVLVLFGLVLVSTRLVEGRQGPGGS